MSEKVGIITFHAAYNYGSVLQAYATQYTVNKLGYECEIINYRLAVQKDIYSLYPLKMGIRVFFRSLLQIPVMNKRIKRAKKFESFFLNRFQMTAEFKDYRIAKKYLEKYKVVISGSDQIWNKHSLELESASWNYMRPYLLSDYCGKKISYASSLPDMTEEEISKILKYIKKFNNLSFREKSICKKIKKLCNCEVSYVVDPTLLLGQDEWRKVFDIKKNNCKFIFFYSLGGIREMREKIKVLNEYAKSKNAFLKVVTPNTYIYINDENIIYSCDEGPIDFINDINNCIEVITDSYHGTIFAINFNKNFFSISKSDSSDSRKDEILSELGIEHRKIRSVYEINTIIQPIDYKKVNKKLTKLRNESKEYILNSIGNIK